MYLALFLCAMQFDKMPSWTPDELKVSSRFEFTGHLDQSGTTLETVHSSELRTELLLTFWSRSPLPMLRPGPSS